MRKDQYNAWQRAKKEREALAASKPEPQAQAGELLQRWGKAPDGSKYLLMQMPDGYWTPWHIASEAIAKKDAALKACVEALKYYASVCGEDDQPSPAKDAITQAEGAMK